MPNFQFPKMLLFLFFLFFVGSGAAQMLSGAEAALLVARPAFDGFGVVGEQVVFDEAGRACGAAVA
ncbi:hypothetical protein [Kitasatospora herbaricolor]|uniref:Uncharacterized protein n=1 Tax=Kitasatospora herbaricolor TaxID=68217 RepID=A0ABZ1WJF7_9ACTN|nr:hypothetical protein [Kitasatospora herbaricolor]